MSTQATIQTFRRSPYLGWLMLLSSGVMFLNSTLRSSRSDSTSTFLLVAAGIMLVLAGLFLFNWYARWDGLHLVIKPSPVFAKRIHKDEISSFTLKKKKSYILEWSDGKKITLMLDQMNKGDRQNFIDLMEKLTQGEE